LLKAIANSAKIPELPRLRAHRPLRFAPAKIAGTPGENALAVTRRAADRAS
jgi:hypothetical protein